MNYSKLSLAVLLAASLSAWAQEKTPAPAAAPAAQAETANNASSVLTIPPGEPGQCQALVITPPEFKPTVEKVLIQEEYETIEIIPARYEWVEEKVEVKPASERLEIVPAKFKTVEEQFVTEPEMTQMEVVPPEFQEVGEEVIVRPAHMTGQKSQGIQGEVMRMVEKPAEVKKVARNVVKTPASVREVVIPAKYRTLEKQVLDTPAEVKKIEVPAEYTTVRVKKMVEPAREVRNKVPAEYTEVEVMSKVQDAQMRWERVLCAAEVDGDMNKKIQTALIRHGYDIGKVDGKLGSASMRALEDFQRRNNLAVGNVTLETIDALGIKR